MGGLALSEERMGVGGEKVGEVGGKEGEGIGIGKEGLFQTYIVLEEFSYTYSKYTIKGFALKHFDFVLNQQKLSIKKNSVNLNKSKKPTNQLANQQQTETLAI